MAESIGCEQMQRLSVAIDAMQRYTFFFIFQIGGIDKNSEFMFFLDAFTCSDPIAVWSGGMGYGYLSQPETLSIPKLSERKLSISTSKYNSKNK